MADKHYQGEKLEKQTTTRKVFFFHDTIKAIKQISREVFLKEDKVIHYPRAFDGGGEIQNHTIIHFHRV
jgi:hypothetical protein